MVCKSANANFEMRIVSKLIRFVDCEIGCLRLLQNARNAVGAPVLRVPRVYACDYEPKTQDYCLLLEDLRPRCPGVQANGCNPAEAKQVLSMLGDLHGHYWENYGDCLSFATKPNDRRNRVVPMLLEESWPKFVKWAKAQAPGVLPDLAKAMLVGKQACDSKGRWQHEMSKAPLTLVHGDCHNENYMWTPDRSEVCAIDFQLCAISQGAFDVANFIVMSMLPEVLAEQPNLEEDLLQHYYGALTAAVTARKAHELTKAQAVGSSAASVGAPEGASLLPVYSFAELKRRYTSGLCYTLCLEGIGQGMQDSKELANTTLQNKRRIVFQRILAAINRNEQTPSIFFSV
jgi:hypothetical protein